MPEPNAVQYREIGPERTGEFLSKGYRGRHFFPHQFYYLPKCGPDGLKLAQRMCGPCRPEDSLEIVLYAHPSLAAGFPEKLFFDNDLCWHQQQFGKTGQIATVNLLRRGGDIYTMVHQSDLVQRASRAGEYRTQLQNRFKGWNFMLLNSILNFATEQKISSVYTPTSKLALRNTHRARNVGTELFDRVYDHQVQQIFTVHRAGEWWRIDVDENRNRVIHAETKHESIAGEKVICLCHDIERGLGHLDSDLAFADIAEKTSPASLTEILRIERQAGIRATYNVVGQLLPDVREEIESGGHCLAFHSYNHRLVNDEGQLGPCRSIDYRLKGYRPPQSKITPELSEENLCFHNFEWLASSAYSLGFGAPRMSKGLVKIPIDFDDYELYRDHWSWEVWEKRALKTIKERDFIAFSLHDCYAPFWLNHYAGFLEKVGRLGKLTIMDDVMNAVVMSHAQ